MRLDDAASSTYRLLPGGGVVGVQLGDNVVGDRYLEGHFLELRAENALYERFRTVPLGEWQNYTPVEDSAITALGNGVLDGRYTLIGKTVHFWARLIVGSTTTFNAATLFRLSLPLTANNVPVTVNLHAMVLDAGVATYPAQGIFWDVNRMYARLRKPVRAWLAA
jgi:hypothetical protein